MVAPQTRTFLCPPRHRAFNNGNYESDTEIYPELYSRNMMYLLPISTKSET